VLCCAVLCRVLPQGLGGLPLLRTIILEGNLLQELPVDLFKLPRLHTLNASHNQLTALPDKELLAASELHYLDVRWGMLIGSWGRGGRSRVAS
jgi:Leucine-rich repeat (LRR) protein